MSEAPPALVLWRLVEQRRWRPGRDVLVGVRDDGPGMTTEAQARLFERGLTTKPPSRGTSVGLASARNLLVATGGGITFKWLRERGRALTCFCPWWLSAPRQSKRLKHEGKRTTVRLLRFEFRDRLDALS